MTSMPDGQVKCDECGALDGNTDIKLLPGWTRQEPEPRVYLHYCPGCSLMEKEAVAGLRALFGPCAKCKKGDISGDDRCPLCGYFWADEKEAE